jgi:hypothetical protein
MRSVGQQSGAAGIGALRVAVGLGLSLAPRLTGSNDDSALLLTQTVGIRDIALGLGTVAAARTGSTADTRRWLGIGLMSDVADLIAAVVSVRQTGRRGLAALVIPIPVIATDLWLLARVDRRI